MEIEQFQLGELGTNCYLLFDQQTAVVIDPGGDPGELIAFCRERQIRPQVVLATHGHFDHVGGVRKIVEEWQIPFAASSLDSALYEHAVSQGRLFGCVDLSNPPRPEIDLEQVLKDGGELDGPPFGPTSDDPQDTGSIRVIRTPGHTPGSVTFAIGDHLFVGDVLFRGSIGRTDLPGGDYETIMATIRNELLSRADGTVYPGHGPITTIAEERRSNPFLR